MKINKQTAVIRAALAAALLMPGWAMAACTFSAAATDSISFGRVVVQRDAPVGTILATQSIVSRGASWNCTSNYVYTGNLPLFSTPNPIGGKVYSTNIPGVGMRVHFYAGYNADLPISQGVGPSASYHGGTLAAFLIKTSAAAVGSGNLTSGALVNFKVDATTVYTLNLSGTNTIVPVACSVSSRAISVPMGEVARNTFTGPGHVSTPVPFFIPLVCDAGTRVQITLDATRDSSGAPGVIALTSAGSPGVASGVGIQLTHSGAPVSFGTAIPLLTSTGGALNIPLVARYYQTLPAVTAGNANAQATFTMTYN